MYPDSFDTVSPLLLFPFEASSFLYPSSGYCILLPPFLLMFLSPSPSSSPSHPSLPAKIDKLSSLISSLSKEDLKGKRVCFGVKKIPLKIGDLYPFSSSKQSKGLIPSSFLIVFIQIASPLSFSSFIASPPPSSPSFSKYELTHSLASTSGSSRLCSSDSSIKVTHDRVVSNLSDLSKISKISSR
jgi:hypothetical protein